MVWRLFATKLETAETMEGVALNMRAPYFYPTSTHYDFGSLNLAYSVSCQNIFGLQDGLAMICSTEEIGVESTKPGIFTPECDLDRIRRLKEQKDVPGQPKACRTKPGILRDWRFPAVFRKIFKFDD